MSSILDEIIQAGSTYYDGLQITSPGAGDLIADHIIRGGPCS